MIISLIVAASAHDAIGRRNALPWHLPNDLKFFKNTTWGMPLIMGRKTYESIAKEPLPGRFNIVISRQRDFDPGSDKVRVAGSLEEAIRQAEETNCKEAFVAGGGELYALAMPIASRIYLTRVHADFPDADVFFPPFSREEWTCRSSLDFSADEKHPYDYSFQLWERRP
jgi:dihydrofolate reductase